MANVVSSRPPRPARNRSQRLSTQRAATGGGSSAYSSQISAITPTGTPFYGDEDFELMNVKITVLGLTGIVTETKNSKKQSTNPMNRRSSFSAENSYRRSTQSSTISSLSSADVSAVGDHGEPAPTPTVAVVAFQRNVSNSETVIATHLPSQPLGPPASIYGTNDRHVASWPTENNAFMQSDGVDRSSFTLLRVMMREGYEGYDADSVCGGSTVGTSRTPFATESIDIHIGVCRGKDMIPLGISSLIITGEEEGAEIMLLPAKPLSGRKSLLGMGNRRRKSKLFRSTKKACFPDDPSRTYKLDESATLRVMVKVLPNDAVKAVEALTKTTEETQESTDDIENDRRKTIQVPESATNPLLTRRYSFRTPKEANPKGFFFGPDVFCGCAQLVNRTEAQQWQRSQENGKDSDFTVDNSTMNSYARQYAVSCHSSVVSSVSGSESGSDDESVDPDTVHVNRKIVIKKKTNSGQQKEVLAARATLRKQAKKLGVQPQDLL